MIDQECEDVAFAETMPAEHGSCLPMRMDRIGTPQAADTLRIDRNDC
ncbi:hypothetical protein [Burkholderia pseudomultivorans]|nr:hypothetical protein [Burkholderia pseudomultivorans]